MFSALSSRSIRYDAGVTLVTGREHPTRRGVSRVRPLPYGNLTSFSGRTWNVREPGPLCTRYGFVMYRRRRVHTGRFVSQTPRRHRSRPKSGAYVDLFWRFLDDGLTDERPSAEAVSKTEDVRERRRDPKESSTGKRRTAVHTENTLQHTRHDSRVSVARRFITVQTLPSSPASSTAGPRFYFPDVRRSLVPPRNIWLASARGPSPSSVGRALVLVGTCARARRSGRNRVRGRRVKRGECEVKLVFFFPRRGVVSRWGPYADGSGTCVVRRMINGVSRRGGARKDGFNYFVIFPHFFSSLLLDSAKIFPVNRFSLSFSIYLALSLSPLALGHPFDIW